MGSEMPWIQNLKTHERTQPMKKIYGIILALIILVIAWNFFGPKKFHSHPEKEFRFVIASEPPTLDWSLATDNVSADILFNLMEGLIQFDSDLNVKPALAERWDISSDGKRYTFHLRSDALWTDGKPILASHFVDGWERLLNPKTASDYAYFLFDVKNAKEYNAGKLTDFDTVGIHAQDDHTLVVDLWHPASYFLKIPFFWVTFPIRKDIIEQFKDAWTDPKNIVTCGPFRLKEWKHDYSVTLEANPSYYGEKPKISTATAYIINEDSTALSLYDTNKVDLIRRIPPLLISHYKNLADYKNSPFLRGYYYGMNVKKKPFTDSRIRKAFSLAIDRSQLSTILQGNQIPTSSWIPKGMFGYDETIGLKFDKEKAQLLLAQAGYPKGEHFPSIKMVYDTRDDNKIIAEFLQSQWKEHLNVTVSIDNQEWKVHLKMLETNPPELWRLGWGADFPDPDNFMNLFTSYSGNNHTQWKNKEYDQLIEEAAKELDSQKRLTLYQKAQHLLTEEDVPIIPLFIDSQNVLLKSYVKGYTLNPMSNNILKNISISKND
ncbi:MAG TPA: oligopeptide-binding protein oppA [Deltaproteobacteria bacterium]|nr:oligopeptide-binding protein oppA [Deltaproteobacteria bacterium]